MPARPMWFSARRRESPRLTSTTSRWVPAASRSQARWRTTMPAFQSPRAGDVNGDGFADLIVGAVGDDAGGNYAGAAYVVLGAASGITSINLDTIALGTGGFKITGENGFDKVGWSVLGGGRQRRRLRRCDRWYPLLRRRRRCRRGLCGVWRGERPCVSRPRRHRGGYWWLQDHWRGHLRLCRLFGFLGGGRERRRLRRHDCRRLWQRQLYRRGLCGVRRGERNHIRQPRRRCHRHRRLQDHW